MLDPLKDKKNEDDNFKIKVRLKERGECRKQWMLAFYRAQQACRDPKHPTYKYIGGKGIKCFITKQEIKELWLENEAYLMSHPRFIRKNKSLHYTKDNCHFVSPKKPALKLTEDEALMVLKCITDLFRKARLDVKYVRLAYKIRESFPTVIQHKEIDLIWLDKEINKIIDTI